jgi:hypothetical protein
LITWALVKSVILILGGERREENLEKETVASLHEYKLDAGDVEKITKESKWCFSHGFTVLEETESKPPLAAPAIAMVPPRETSDFFPSSPREGGIGMNILKWETLKRKCAIYIFTLKRAWEERMTFH